MRRPDQEKQVVNEPIPLAPTAKQQRSVTILDVLNLVAMVVLIALILYFRFSGHDDVYFSTEFPPWDRRV